MNRQLSLPLLLIALLLAWALVSPQDPLLQPPPTVSESTAPTPDSYAHGVVAYSYDREGKLRSRTQAEALRRFNAVEEVELAAPRRWEFDGDDEWFARAERGLLRERQDLLELRGNAQLEYLSGGAQLHTEALMIDITRKTARSLAPVDITQEDGHRMRAEQLVMELDLRRALFTGRVHSLYVPEP